MSVPILNASGCLDALAAPEVARSLDAFVTKTITPEPREGNPPVRIAEAEHGMLNSIGLQGPGIEAFAATQLPRLGELGVPCGCPSAASRRRTSLSAPSGSTRSRSSRRSS
jgi:dihydroorotate dehydrogenase (NAD+) catalytic subunit